MEITPIQVTIADLTKNYKDDGDGGVPIMTPPTIASYQREFVYKDNRD